MAATRNPQFESPILTRLSLFGALGLGLLFRLPGIEWGLPLKYAHIDESVVIHYSMRIVAGAMNPEFYDYPGFFLYLLAGVIRMGALVHGWFFGTGLEELVGGYLAGDSAFFTLGARGLSVAFALFTIALTFDLGRRRGRWMVGFGAAVLLSVNGLHVLHSHYGTLDVAACFFTLLAMDKIAQFGVTQGVRDGGEAAFWVGLAAATKYYPGILFVPLALLPFVGRHPKPIKMLAVLSVLAFVGLFVGSPFTVLSSGEFLSRFNHLAPKIVGLPGHSIPFIQTIMNLWQNAGPLAVIAGVIGIGFSFKEKGAWRTLAVLWLTLFAFLGFWTHQPPHYSLALFPPLFLFSIRAADEIPWRRPWPAVVLMGLLFLLSTPAAVREVRYLQLIDTRLQAAEWVRKNIPPGSKILRFSHTPDFKRSDPFQIQVDFTDNRLAWMGQGPDDQKRGMEALKEFDYLIVSGTLPEGELVKNSFALLSRFSEPAPMGFHNPLLSIYATVHPAAEKSSHP